MSEVPKEPGRWACKLKLEYNLASPPYPAIAGEIRQLPGCLEFRGCLGARMVSLPESAFHQFEWHRIELPEGWE